MNRADCAVRALAHTPAKHDAIWARYHAEAAREGRFGVFRAEEAALAAQQAAIAAERHER
jgi:hypothetical protein